MISINTNKILIPIDFSEISTREIKHAASIARVTKGELILLHVQRKKDLIDILLPLLDLNDTSKIQEFLKNKLEKLARRVKKEYGVKVTAVVSVGNIATEITDMAVKKEAGLIVMGTQGSDSTNDLFLG